jgi:Flp pilus assembly pilin Flp
MEALKRFLRDESGLETVEQAFVLGFVILIAVLAFVLSQGHLRSIFSETINKLSDAASSVAGGP